MKVEILTATEDRLPLIWIAARTCKSEATPSEICDKWNDEEVSIEECTRLAKALWKAGHYSVFEHVNISYAISGISRACLAQLSRHRFLSMSVQSQRYVKTDLWQALRLEGNPPKQTAVVIPPSFGGKGREIYLDALHQVVKACDELTGLGVPLEDIRYLYPGGTTTNLVLTCNLRTLGELNEKRAQNKAAQWEIRELVKRMVDLAVEDMPWWGECLDPAGNENR